VDQDEFVHEPVTGEQAQPESTATAPEGVVGEDSPTVELRALSIEEPPAEPAAPDAIEIPSAKVGDAAGFVTSETVPALEPSGSEATDAAEPEAIEPAEAAAPEAVEAIDVAAPADGEPEPGDAVEPTAPEAAELAPNEPEAGETVEIAAAAPAAESAGEEAIQWPPPTTAEAEQAAPTRWSVTSPPRPAPRSGMRSRRGRIRWGRNQANPLDEEVHTAGAAAPEAPAEPETPAAFEAPAEPETHPALEAPGELETPAREADAAAEAEPEPPAAPEPEPEPPAAPEPEPEPHAEPEPEAHAEPEPRAEPEPEPEPPPAPRAISAAPSEAAPEAAPSRSRPAPAPAPVFPAEVSDQPGFRERGRLRRRARYLRHLREVQLRDLGGFLLELHRFEVWRGDLVGIKLAEVAETDRELRALESALSEQRPMGEVREAGIGGLCRRCGAIHGSVDRFCAACGSPLVEDASQSRVVSRPRDVRQRPRGRRAR
jgi:hypothetical protein